MKEKAVKWVKNKWLIAFAIIVVLMFIAGKPLAVFIGWLSGIDVDNDISAGDLLRSFILLFGVIGGGYGLYLSAKRQKTFSDQVQVQVNQDFNDRLGRGVELLTNESIVMRCAGINVLEDLANNASEAQKSIVANIIYDFFCDKMVIKSDGDYDVGHSVENRQDLQNALDFLVGLPSREREKSLQKRIVNGRLNLCRLNFIHLRFANKLLENIDFSHSYFYESEFRSDKIMNVSFCDAKFKSSSFGIEYNAYPLPSFLLSPPPESIIFGCDFSNTEFSNTNFYDMIIESSNCSDIQFVGGGFHDVEFLGGNFCFNGNMDITPDLDLPRFFGTDLGDSDFNFSYDIDLNKFFKFCYAPMDKQGNIMNLIDESRAYKFVDESQGYEFVDLMRKVFVESDELWSGQPVEEWVAVEKAQWKLEQIKSFPSWKDNKKDVNKAKSDLEIAISILHRSQEFFRIPNKTPQSTPSDKPNP